MRKIPLGPDAPTVSAMGFGGMPLSTTGRPPEPAAEAVIHAVLDAGVTLIDTANVYCLDQNDLGHNERLVARATKSHGSTSGLVVATKGGMARPEGRWERSGHPDALRRACEQSLRALEVDCIDLYQLHTPDPAVPFTDSVGALARLREEGKARQVGLSNVTVDQIQAAETIVPITTVQNRLSPFFREAIDGGVVKYCGNRGIGFLAYSPVGGGRLNKTLPNHPAARAVGDHHGVSAHVAVLAWVLAQGSTVIPIPGARSVDHALDALAALDVQLTDADRRAIDEAEFSTAR